MSLPIGFSARVAFVRWRSKPAPWGVERVSSRNFRHQKTPQYRCSSSMSSDDHVDPRLFSQHVVERSEFLARLTGLPANKFKPLVKDSEPIRRASESQLESVVKLLEDKGFEAEGVLEEPRILVSHPLLIDNYYQCLKDLGHANPPLKLIKLYPYLSKQRISRLRADGTVPRGDLIKLLLKPFTNEEAAELEPEIRASVPPDYVQEWTLQDIWSRIQASYLSKKCSLDVKIAVYLLSTNVRIRNKSLTYFRENLCILKDLVKLPKTRLLTHSYLLSGHPANMLKIWNEIPTIAGLPTREVVLKAPKLLMCPAGNFAEIESLLMRECKVSPRSVQNMLDVYTLSPSTVRERLEEIDRVPHFKALKSHPNVLKLVVYQHKAKMRLQELESMNMKNMASLHLLSSSTAHYERAMGLGYGRSRGGRDMVLLLAAALNVDSAIVKEELSKHPYWTHVPLVEVKSALTLLLVRGFSEEQILNAVQLLLYPEDLILQFLESVPRKPELQPFDDLWRNHPRFLHLVLYYIERDSNFSGSAVFREQATTVGEDVPDDDDEGEGDHEVREFGGGKVARK